MTAVADLADGAEIILYQNVDLGTSKAIFAGNATLDLNGYTLSSKVSSYGPVVVHGTLVIEDSSSQGTGTIQNTATSSSYGVLVDADAASLTLNSGNISATTQGVRVSKGTFTCNGGSITATNYGVYVGGTSVATINGGYIASGFDTFNNCVYASGSTTVAITGGYFNGSAPNGSGLKGGISGGYYARKVATANIASYLAEGCYYEDNLDSVYLFMVINPNAQPEVPTEPELPEESESVVDRWNLVLDDDLLVNFYVNAEEDAQVQVNFAGETVTYATSDLQVAEDGKYIVPVRVSAAQMTEAITVQIVGSDAGAESYTVRQYANAVLADSELSAYHALVKEMLNYGGAAQTYFQYHTENMANADIADAGEASIPEAADEMVVTDASETVGFFGAAMVYRDKIAVRFYFSGDVSGCTFTDANGNSYTAAEKDGKYYVEIADILPQDLDQQLTLTVTDADGNAVSVTYGPMNYIVRMNAKGSDSLKALLKALYNYHLAAKELRTAV